MSDERSLPRPAVFVVAAGDEMHLYKETVETLSGLKPSTACGLIGNHPTEAELAEGRLMCELCALAVADTLPPWPPTGIPPCDYCVRDEPCDCGGEICKCTCGRCMAPR